MKKDLLIPQDVAHRVIRDSISTRVGFSLRYSTQGLSDATGIPRRTIESYKDGSATPGLANLLSLFAALGPSFTSDILAACGQCARSGTDDEPEHMRVLTALGSLTAQIAEAVEDGQVDHREAAAIRPTVQHLIEVLEPLARREP